MTHDETALARWLDRPVGTEPDADLDPEVIEAVFALRPDLAPAPRVSVDDILNAVEEGPLAQRSGPPTVLEDAPHPSEGPAPANRSMASWGGWRGIGLAAVAAATFLVVAMPGLQRDAPEPAAQMDAAPAAARAPAAQDPVDTAPPAAAAEPARPPAAAPAAKRAPRVELPPAAAPDDAYDMAEDAPVRERSLIPELAEVDAVADAEAGADDDLDALRAAAVPDAPTSDWSDRVPRADAKRVQKILDDAAALAPTDPRGAAELAATAVAPPTAAAHAAALASSAYYLQAGDARAATAVALRGLQMRDDSAAWAALAVRYADLIRSSDPEGAAGWYRDAVAR